MKKVVNEMNLDLSGLNIIFSKIIQDFLKPGSKDDFEFEFFDEFLKMEDSKLFFNNIELTKLSSVITAFEILLIKDQENKSLEEDLKKLILELEDDKKLKD